MISLLYLPVEKKGRNSDTPFCREKKHILDGRWLSMNEYRPTSNRANLHLQIAQMELQIGCHTALYLQEYHIHIRAIRFS